VILPFRLNTPHPTSISPEGPATLLRLHLLDILQHLFLVPLRLNFFVNLPHDAFRIDQKGGAFPKFHPVPLDLPYSARLVQFGVRIGEQIDSEAEFVAKALMRIDIIGTYAHDVDAGLLEIATSGAEGLSFESSARCVVFRIGIDDEPFAREIRELHRLSVLILQREIREGLPSFEHVSLLLP
jgi:hypothetical protein